MKTNCTLTPNRLTQCSTNMKTINKNMSQKLFFFLDLYRTSSEHLTSSAERDHLSLHNLMDMVKAACSEDSPPPNELSSSPNCVVFPSLFCKRAAPLDGTAHESLTRATSLCSESAVNDKQETIKRGNGGDKKKTTYPCCSRKPTVLVVPHIKLPPSKF